MKLGEKSLCAGKGKGRGIACLLTNEDKCGILKVEKRKQRIIRFCAQKAQHVFVQAYKGAIFGKFFSKKVQYFSKNGVYIGESLIQERRMERCHTVCAYPLLLRL